MQTQTTIAPRKRQHKAKSFAGIDTEGIGSRCVLIGTSCNLWLEERNRISSAQALEFLTGLPNAVIWVAFSFSYDVTMILQDLPLESLDRLRRFGHCRWDHYKITHIPGKKFAVTDMKSRKSIAIWDLWPFVQSSFIKMLESFELGTPKQRTLIAENKALRDEFAHRDREKIREYCLLECSLMAQGMQKIKDAALQAGIPLNAYYGAGSVASAMMQSHGVKGCIAPTPDNLLPMVRSAYFGGRSEISIVGMHSEKVYTYDINSAYPFAAIQLPCLAHGKWSRIESPNNIAGMPLSTLCYVVWRLPADSVFGPFPFRPAKGASLRYPTSGEGWYWLSEVLAALQLYPGQIGVQFCVSWQPNCTHQPFDFIPEAYRQRKLLGKNTMAGKVIKLGINALYGKTAQQVGKEPPYQSFIWAGMITAQCRSQILDAIRLCPGRVLAIATDGIVADSPIDLPVSSELGDWEAKEYPALFIAQCGVYFWPDEEGEWQKKSRGFLMREIDFEKVRAEWEANGTAGKVTCVGRRFVGYRAAIARGKLYSACSCGDCGGKLLADWHLIPRVLSFSPEPRRIVDEFSDGHYLLSAPTWESRYDMLEEERDESWAEIESDNFDLVDETGESLF